MKKTVVINVVGLTAHLIGAHTPFLKKWTDRHRLARIKPVLPAVTCSAQSTYLTGKWPSEHGIVANGWYFRTEKEIKFWRQSNSLVQSPKIWDEARKLDPDFTCANMFWWYNMYSTADYSVTPRPQYLADGRKIPDCYSHPAALREELQAELGTFPLFSFWGPNTSIKSTKWIADASILTDKKYDPTLTLVYLPHLDYNLQRHGHGHPSVAKDLLEIDAVCADLISYYEGTGASVLLLSEYGITDVNRPIHLNRLFRQKGWINVRTEQHWELLDAGASKVFAVADHQLAHVYVSDPALKSEVRTLLENTPGIGLVLDDAGKKAHHLDHPRSGELVAVADNDSWFTYYFWMDDKKAPDFARMVDIHKKPGYDPVEMFFDPKLPFPMAKAAWIVLKKKLGFRAPMNLIPLDASLVKGSHGNISQDPVHYPVLIGNIGAADLVESTDVYGMILRQLTGQG